MNSLTPTGGLFSVVGALAGQRERFDHQVISLLSVVASAYRYFARSGERDYSPGYEIENSMIDPAVGSGGVSPPVPAPNQSTSPSQSRL